MQEKARTLIESLPYIRTYHGKTVVVKVGGEALDDPATATVVAEDLALMTLVGIRVVIVHGGGPQISRTMAAAGLEPRFVGGLRVTDLASIEVVRQVLVGSINFDLVTRLNQAGLRALGLSGVDGGLIKAVKTQGANGEDIGNVGRVESVRGDVLLSLLGSGFSPVVASVAASADGTPLNVNADEVAGAVAAAIRASKLAYVTNVEGLYRDLGDSGSLLSELTLAELRDLLPALSDGMRPKAVSAVTALEAGVPKVHFIDGRIEHALLLEIFTDQGIGTQVTP